jgi:pimeloyl-ACP methyl ester carboxylesterase
MHKRYIQTKKGQMHVYEIESSAEEIYKPLLCLHPAPFSGLFFKTIMPLLNKNRRIVAPDYPGYGNSYPMNTLPKISDYADAINEGFLQNEDLKQYDLIGFHTGCLVANELSIINKYSVDRVIMIDIPYFNKEEQKRLYPQVTTPLTISEDLESLRKVWDFNIKNRIDNVSIERSFELFIENLKPEKKDYFAFHAAFTYACEEKFKSNPKHIHILATKSMLLEATHIASKTLSQAKIIDIHNITSNVFEEGAEIIAEHVLSVLNAN